MNDYALADRRSWSAARVLEDYEWVSLPAFEALEGLAGLDLQVPLGAGRLGAAGRPVLRRRAAAGPRGRAEGLLSRGQPRTGSPGWGSVLASGGSKRAGDSQ